MNSKQTDDGITPAKAFKSVANYLQRFKTTEGIELGKGTSFSYGDNIEYTYDDLVKYLEDNKTIIGKDFFITQIK